MTQGWTAGAAGSVERSGAVVTYVDRRARRVGREADRQEPAAVNTLGHACFGRMMVLWTCPVSRVGFGDSQRATDAGARRGSGGGRGGDGTLVIGAYGLGA